MPTESEISVHDNHLIAYTVMGKEKRIVLHTESPDKKSHEYVDVIFEEVLAYHFENDLFGTIIFDIEEVKPVDILERYSGMFEKGRSNGWPRGWDDRKESIDTYVGRLEMRGFELSSSLGMEGWVLAKTARRMKVVKQRTIIRPRNVSPMRIIEIREKTVSMAAAIQNAYIDFSKMTCSVVLV